MARTIYTRYRRELSLAMTIYLVIMVLLWPSARHVTEPVLKIALAVTPMLPMIFVVRAIVRLVMDSDELEQRLHLIGLAVATAVVTMLSLLGGFLATAGVFDLGNSVLIWVFPVMLVTYTGGRLWAARRYGVDDALTASCSRNAPLRLLAAALAIGVGAWASWGHVSDYLSGLFVGLAVGLVISAGSLLAWRLLRSRGATPDDD